MHDNINFNLECKEDCYLLGFLWADAYVGSCPSHKGYSFSFEIVKDDFVIIWPLLKRAGFSKFTERLRRNSKRAQCCTRTARQDNLEFFLLWGFQNKDLGCPLYFTLSSEMRRFFIKGFLDGDGSISLDRNGLFRVGFNGSKNQSWDFLEDFLSRHGVRYAIYRKNRLPSHTSHTKSHGYSVLEFTQIQERVNFCKLIESCNVGLERKINIYKKFRNLRLSKRQETRRCKNIDFSPILNPAGRVDPYTYLKKPAAI